MTTGRSLRIGEAAFGGLLLFLGLFVAFETTQLSAGPGYAAVGPALFPYMIAAGLVLIGLLVLREAFFGHIAHERGMELDWWSVALVIAGLAVQGLLLLPLGWIVATAALFVVVARAFGSRRPLLDAVIGLVLAAGTFVIFNYGLGLNLPGGMIAERFG